MLRLLACSQRWIQDLGADPLAPHHRCPFRLDFTKMEMTWHSRAACSQKKAHAKSGLISLTGAAVHWPQKGGCGGLASGRLPRARHDHGVSISCAQGGTLSELGQASESFALVMYCWTERGTASKGCASAGPAGGAIPAITRNCRLIGKFFFSQSNNILC